MIERPEVAALKQTFKSGKIKNPDRPYETSKLHSDAWVGMFGDGIISFGIMGDFANNGVEFFMPELIRSDYFSKLKNYDEGMSKFKGLKKIGGFDKSFIHMFDNIVLHKTMNKKNSLPRVSIDLSFILKNRQNNLKFTNKDIQKYNFYKTNVYEKCGKNFFYIAFESINQTSKRLISNKNKLKKDKFIEI